MLIDFLGHLPGYLKNEVSSGTLASYYLSFLALALGQMSPLAVLLACLSVAGEMAKANEITALRAGGISPVRAISPLLAGAVCVTFLALLTGEGAVPPAARRLSQLRRAAFKRVHTANNIPYGNEQGRYMIIGAVDTEREVMERVHLEDPSQAGGLRLRAEVGIWQADAWELYRGVVSGRSGDQEGEWAYSFARAGRHGLYELIPPEDKEKRQAQEKRLGELTALLKERGKEEEKRFHSYIQKLKQKGQIKHHPQLRIVIEETPRELLEGECKPQEMTYRRLRRYINNLRRAGFKVRSLSVELKTKLSFPLANLIVALVGIPFGLRLRWGGMAMGVGAAVGLGLVYHFLTYLSKAMGTSVLSPTLGAWLPNLIFAAAGIYLLHRASK